jgi:hypothetical protein
MAVYGIGAAYGGNRDKTKDFLDKSCACIGWNEHEAPSLHKMLSKIKISDFIYIKSMSIATKELIVKAVGIVVDDNIEEKGKLGKGVTVEWLWNGKESIPITTEMYKNNVFNNTLYEEYLPHIQRRIIDLVLNKESIGAVKLSPSDK